MTYSVISSEEAFIPSAFYLGEVKAHEWEKIESAKRQCIITDDPGFDLFRYPGLVFSDEDFAAKYFQTYKDLGYDSVYTPPRGNLSLNNDFIFMGIKPGHFYAHQGEAETSWLFGPSVVILFGLLYNTGVFPYFTNVYKFHADKEDQDTQKIEYELLMIHNLRQQIYNKKSTTIVCLGKYPEYEKIFKNLKSEEGLKFISIWHPAYLTRQGRQETFDYWVDDFIEKAELNV